MLRDGAVAHYGLWNLLKPGWEEELLEARSDLDSIVNDLKTLSDDHVSLSDGDKKELRNKWLTIRKKVAASQKTLSSVEARYGLSKEEKQVVALVMSQRLAEISGVADPALPSLDPRLSTPPPRSVDDNSSSQSTTRPAPLKPTTTKSEPAAKNLSERRSKPASPDPAGPKPPGATNSE